jgi:tetratricopeptide (TPR) repeat protein
VPTTELEGNAAMADAPHHALRLERLLGYLAQDPLNRSLRKDAAREAIEAGDWDRACEVLDAGLRLHPDDGGLLALTGFAQLRTGEPGRAERSLDAAIRHGWDGPELRYKLALALFLQGRHHEALLQLDPPGIAHALPTAQLLKARCRHHLGQSDEAMADCAGYLARAPRDADGQGLLALLAHERGERERAHVHAELALAANPGQPEALLARAGLQNDDGDIEAAIATFDHLLLAVPDCGRGWFGRALAHTRRHRLDAAARDIEQAARHLGGHIGTWHVMGWLRILENDATGAGVAFAKALALDRNFAETHGALAVVAALEGREAEARNAIRRAQRLDPQALSALYAELVLRQRAGDVRGAQTLFESFLDRPVAGGDGPWRALLARHMESLGVPPGGQARDRLLH